MEISTFVNLSLVLGLLNLIALVVVVILPEWRVSLTAASDPSLRGLSYKEGLWLSCTAHHDEYFQCGWRFNTMGGSQYDPNYGSNGLVGIDGN